MSVWCQFIRFNIIFPSTHISPNNMLDSGFQPQFCLNFSFLSSQIRVMLISSTPNKPQKQLLCRLWSASLCNFLHSYSRPIVILGARSCVLKYPESVLRPRGEGSQFTPRKGMNTEIDFLLCILCLCLCLLHTRKRNASNDSANA